MSFSHPCLQCGFHTSVREDWEGCWTAAAGLCCHLGEAMWSRLWDALKHFTLVCFPCGLGCVKTEWYVWLAARSFSSPQVFICTADNGLAWLVQGFTSCSLHFLNLLPSLSLQGRPYLIRKTHPDFAYLLQWHNLPIRKVYLFIGLCLAEIKFVWP